ncbi:MAG: ABC transporter ATP-binding protein [Thermoplasmata archaeon]
MGETKVIALDKVSMNVRRGELVSIMGPSGSGKSTLLNLIGCIDTPTSGTVNIDGQDVSKLSDKELTKIRLRKIGFIFQQFYLIPTLTAIENVELPMKEAGVPKSKRIERAKELLELVGLKGRINHYPNQLSGGEQQRVAIARALSNEPKLLLADEPTGEVDSDTSKRIMTLLKDLNREKGLTMIIVTHDPNIGNQTNRIIKLLDGKISKK